MLPPLSHRTVMLPRVFTTFALLALLAPPASAQDSLSVAARLVMRQPPGVRLRLLAENEQITGVLERVGAGTLSLSDPPRTLRLSTIDDAWLQRRSTGRGAKVGAIVGASGGAVLFGLGALVLSGLDSGIDGPGDIALAAGFGGVLGAGSGFLVGSLIGAGIPRWERITESSAPPVIAAGADSRRSGFSSFTVTPALTRPAHEGEAGFGASVAYLTQLTSSFALGPELGIYMVNAPDHISGPSCVPEIYCPPPIEAKGGAWSVAGVARIGSGDARGVRPYGLVGLGLYRFPYGDVLGGYSLGGGLRWRTGSSYALSVEGRWHSNATNPSTDANLGFFTAGVGLTLLR